MADPGIESGSPGPRPGIFLYIMALTSGMSFSADLTPGDLQGKLGSWLSWESQGACPPTEEAILPAADSESSNTELFSVACLSWNLLC